MFYYILIILVVVMIPFLWYEALQVGGSIAISDVGAGRLNDSNTSNWWQRSHIVMVN